MTSFPPNFIPIVDAFYEAVAALEPAEISGRAKDLEISGRAKDLSKAELVEFQDELDEFYPRKDEAERKVERLFRDALADGLIDAWVNGARGMEKLSERESWRTMPVGLAGFEPRTHHLTNPGPNDEREVFIEQGQQKTWIAMTATRQPTQPTDAELDDAIRKTAGPDGRAPSQNKCAEMVWQTYPQVTRDRVRDRYPHVFPGLKQGRGPRKKCAR
jgi:hypothetical protein